MMELFVAILIVMIHVKGINKMNEIIGFIILFIAADFLIVFMLGFELSFLEKIKLSLGMAAFIVAVAIGACLIV